MQIYAKGVREEVVRLSQKDVVDARDMEDMERAENEFMGKFFKWSMIGTGALVLANFEKIMS